MIHNQGALAEATISRTRAHKALSKALNAGGITVEEARPLWTAAQKADARYAEELTAASHGVPVGLVAA